MSKAFCNGNETIVKMIMTGVASHLLTGFSHYIRLDKGGRSEKPHILGSSSSFLLHLLWPNMSQLHALCFIFPGS